MGIQVRLDGSQVIVELYVGQGLRVLCTYLYIYMLYYIYVYIQIHT